MSSTRIVRPAYCRVVHRDGNTWGFKGGKPFYSPAPVGDYRQEDIYDLYGTTMRQVAIELFRINGGKPGYYLANLRDKVYYYCGTEWADVKAQLLEIGIGR